MVSDFNSISPTYVPGKLTLVIVFLCTLIRYGATLR